MNRTRTLALCGAVGLLAVGTVLLARRTPPAPPPPALRAPLATAASGLPSFLVIVPDTFRADRVGRVDNGVPVTPNIDALAARGATFTHAYSASGWTLPALASLLSGRYPLAPSTTEDTSLDFLRTDLQDLPELLQAAGYHTAVFWGPFMGKAPAEFSRGFDHVVTETGDTFENGVVGWLKAQDRRPFFALVHNSDLQFPVVSVPGDPLLTTPPASAEVGLEPTFQVWLSKVSFEQARQTASRAYDATVTRYDAAIGRMVAGLTEAGVADETVLVVTSNHGIELGEHGHYKHGNLNDYDLHIPLVVVDPQLPRRGVRIDTVVQTMDLAPTLLERAGRRAGADLTGRSYLALLGLGTAPYAERDVYSLCSTTTMSLRTPRFKLSRSAPKGAGEESVVTVVYDLGRDPQELTPYLPPFSPEVAAAALRLDAWWAERKAETKAARPSGADPAALKKLLQDNGYWGVMEGTGSGK